MADSTNQSNQDDDESLEQVESDDVAHDNRGRKGNRKKGSLKEDLSKMMQGFGESDDPRDDSLELMEAYVFEFINNLVHRSLSRS